LRSEVIREERSLVRNAELRVAGEAMFGSIYGSMTPSATMSLEPDVKMGSSGKRRLSPFVYIWSFFYQESLAGGRSGEPRTRMTDSRIFLLPDPNK
jgi:hypothetical protein